MQRWDIMARLHLGLGHLHKLVLQAEMAFFSVQ